MREEKKELEIKVERLEKEIVELSESSLSQIGEGR